MDKIMSSKNSVQLSGFTLIEVLVAIVILMVGLLGMLQTINLALDRNIENQYRQNAVAVSEKLLSNQKSLVFNNITARNVLGMERVGSNATFKNFSTEHSVADLATSNTRSKQLSVRVWWRYKARLYEHQTSSAIGNPDLSSGN